MSKVLAYAATALCVALLGLSRPEPVMGQIGPLAGNEGGCRADGEGPNGVAPPFNRRECTYTAGDDSQDVVAVTPNHWEIWVDRQCPIFPANCTSVLLDGDCNPAPENTCSPLLDSDGNVRTERKSVTLLDGPGLYESQETFFEVHPRPGELVTVTIYVDCNTPGLCGTLGFVSVAED